MVDGASPGGLTLYDGYGDLVELPLLLDGLADAREDDGIRVINVVEGVGEASSVQLVNHSARGMWWRRVCCVYH